MICSILTMYNQILEPGADPGFQVRGRGAHLKKIAPSVGRREFFFGISCEKSRFYAKKIIFFPILGGAPWIRPFYLILSYLISYSMR